jgi:hypothetical protein
MPDQRMRKARQIALLSILALSVAPRLSGSRQPD